MRIVNLVIIFLFSGWATPYSLAAPVRTIAIDAGHTLQAQGSQAAGDGLSELAFNQHMALLLGQALKDQGFNVIYGNTPARDKENFKERASISQKADFYISVHHDSVGEKWLTPINGLKGKRFEDQKNQFSGFSIFLSRKAPNLALSQQCASSMGQSLIQAGEHPSLYHADSRFGEVRAFFDQTNGVHYFDGLAVLKNASSAAFLWEVGVIVNTQESIRLRSNNETQKIAKAAALGMANCFN